MSHIRSFVGEKAETSGFLYDKRGVPARYRLRVALTGKPPFFLHFIAGEPSLLLSRTRLVHLARVQVP